MRGFNRRVPPPLSTEYLSEQSPLEDGRRPRVIVAVGTRPEAIKMIPVIMALQQTGFCEVIVITTGQHSAIVDELLAAAGVEPYANLWAVGAGGAELNRLTTNVIERFADFYAAEFGDPPPSRDQIDDSREERPCLVLVHGDTTSAVAVGLAGFHLRIPVVHVEAGLRSGLHSTPFPEEMNRRLIATLACFHLAPTDRNAQNLIREQINTDSIFVSGNTAIDALIWASEHSAEFRDPELAAIDSSDARVVLITAHRRENWGSGFDGIAEGVRLLAERHPDVSFVLPLHPNPDVALALGGPLEGLANVLVTAPLDYFSFARLLNRSTIVLTDSGGLQEEAPALNKPVIVLRDETERQEGIDAGTLLLCGSDPALIEWAGSELLKEEDLYQAMAIATNPYGDGHAAERIVAALRFAFADGPAPIPFGPGYSRIRVRVDSGFEPAQTRDSAAPSSTMTAADHAVELDDPVSRNGSAATTSSEDQRDA
jgi:UDP-N-acetylglucosamine 2-epimerase (non-hydrolysing)